MAKKEAAFFRKKEKRGGKMRQVAFGLNVFRFARITSPD